MKKIVLYICAVLIVAAMVKLGLWQQNRADEKQAIQDYVISQAATPLDLNVSSVAEDNLYQQAFGEGEYLQGQSILIDSQVHKGNVGYHVVTPFKLVDSEQIVLVNSGWVPAGASRNIQPKVSMPNGQLKVYGRLQKPHAKPPIWDDATPLIQNGFWQYLSLDYYAFKNNIQLLSPLILELEPSLEGVGGFQRKWRVYDDTWVNRHKAYSLQWFSMAVAFIFMCLVLELRSRKARKLRK